MKFIELYIRKCKELEEQLGRPLTDEEKKRIVSLAESDLVEEI